MLLINGTSLNQRLEIMNHIKSLGNLSLVWTMVFLSSIPFTIYLKENVRNFQKLNISMGDLPCPFAEIGKKCPKFGQKCPDCCHLWVKFLI